MRDKSTAIGTCQSEEVIEELFGSVSEFARLIDEFGDDFVAGNVRVEYDEETDIHYFFLT